MSPYAQSMATTETQVFMFNAPGDVVPGAGETGFLSINMYNPAIMARVGEGWSPVSHTVSQLDDGNLLVTILALRTSDAPDDAGSLS